MHGQRNVKLYILFLLCVLQISKQRKFSLPIPYRRRALTKTIKVREHKLTTLMLRII